MDYHDHKQLGNYRVLHLLGRGGFADVYSGEHLVDKTQVAIKVLRMHMASTDIEAFYREAQTIAHLKHPHIIEVLDYGLEKQDNTPFFIMQYAPKGTLRERCPKGAILTPGSILSFIQQAASALQYAHDQKLIHRDVKPENMLLTAHDKLLISDFGLAIIMHGSSYQQSNQGVAGTLAYMAPEQFQGHPRAASDQYALGIVAYEWLSGSRPFTGTATEAQAKQALTICESTFRAYHPHIAQYLETLATIYCAQGKYSKAKPLYERAISICEKIWPSDHPDHAQILNSMAKFYLAQHKFNRAEKTCKQALSIYQNIFTADHPRVLQSQKILSAIQQEQSNQKKPL